MKTYTQKTLKTALGENTIARDKCYADAGGEKQFFALPFRAQLAMFVLAESETRDIRKQQRDANKSAMDAFSVWLGERINALAIPKTIKPFNGSIRATVSLGDNGISVVFGRAKRSGSKQRTSGKLLRVGDQTYKSYADLCERSPLRADESLVYKKRGGETIHVLDATNESAQRVWNNRLKSAYPDKYVEPVEIDAPSEN